MVSSCHSVGVKEQHELGARLAVARDERQIPCPTSWVAVLEVVGEVSEEALETGRHVVDREFDEGCR